MQIFSIAPVAALDNLPKPKASRDALVASIANCSDPRIKALAKLLGVHLIHKNKYSISFEVADEAAFRKAVPPEWGITKGAPPDVSLASDAPACKRTAYRPLPPGRTRYPLLTQY